jgi:hypothetical protein
MGASVGYFSKKGSDHRLMGSLASRLMSSSSSSAEQSIDPVGRISVDALPSGSTARAAVVAAAAAAARAAQANLDADAAHAVLVEADAKVRAQAARERVRS